MILGEPQVRQRVGGSEASSVAEQSRQIESMPGSSHRVELGPDAHEIVGLEAVVGAQREEQGLVQISDEGAIKAIVERIVAANPQSVADYKSGKEKAIGFLVGQIMKETKGKANPGLVNQLLVETLKAQ